MFGGDWPDAPTIDWSGRCVLFCFCPKLNKSCMFIFGSVILALFILCSGGCKDDIIIHLITVKALAFLLRLMLTNYLFWEYTYVYMYVCMHVWIRRNWFLSCSGNLINLESLDRATSLWSLRQMLMEQTRAEAQFKRSGEMRKIKRLNFILRYSGLWSSTIILKIKQSITTLWVPTTKRRGKQHIIYASEHRLTY